MSAYPLMLDGAAIEALVVGGGAVAARKARALLAAGARVRIVATVASDAVRALADDARCTLALRPYEPGDVAGATLVVAATDRRDVNARVAADARAAGRLANVADDPAAGNCATVAVHRAGDLVIAVSAGGVPTAAARIRDALAARFDDRYAAAVDALGALRRRLLASGDRAAWQRALDALVSDEFCARVERGGAAEEVAAWR